MRSGCILLLHGKDSESFLNRVSTNVIKDGAMAGICHRNGKPKLLAEIVKVEDSYLLSVNNMPATEAKVVIEKFIITEDVKVQDVTETYKRYIISDYTGDEIFGCKLNGKLFSNIGRGKSPVIYSAPYTSNRDLVILSTDDLCSMPYDSLDLEQRRIQYGYPIWGKEITHDHLIQEANLTNLAISYTKGCYPGQEVIMRLKTYGALSKKLMSVESVGELNKTIITLEGTAIGNIVSSAGVHHLAYITKPFYQNDLFTAECSKTRVEVRKSRFETDFCV